MTNLFHISPYSKDVLTVLQFKSKAGFDPFETHTGHRDSYHINQFTAPVTDLEKLIKLSYPKKQRRYLKTIQNICTKFFSIRARPYRGLVIGEAAKQELRF